MSVEWDQTVVSSTYRKSTKSEWYQRKLTWSRKSQPLALLRCSTFGNSFFFGRISLMLGVSFFLSFCIYDEVHFIYCYSTKYFMVPSRVGSEYRESFSFGSRREYIVDGWWYFFELSLYFLNNVDGWFFRDPRVGKSPENGTWFRCIQNKSESAFRFLVMLICERKALANFREAVPLNSAQRVHGIKKANIRWIYERMVIF